jgi:hypothetical protein
MAETPQTRLETPTLEEGEIPQTLEEGEIPQMDDFLIS